MGLVFLIFLAGFEIDPDVVKGRPVRLAVTGWVISLVLAIGIATASALARRDVRRPVRRRRPDDHGDRHAAADPRGCRHPRHQARHEHPRQRGDRRDRPDHRHLARPDDRTVPDARRSSCWRSPASPRSTMWLATRPARTAHGRADLADAPLERPARRAHLRAAVRPARVDGGRVRPRRPARRVRRRHGGAPVPRRPRGDPGRGSSGGARATATGRCRSGSKRSATGSSSRCSSSSAASASTSTRCSTRSSSSRCRCSSASSSSCAACRRLLYRADLQRDDVVALGLLQAAGLPLHRRDHRARRRGRPDELRERGRARRRRAPVGGDPADDRLVGASPRERARP